MKGKVYIVGAGPGDVELLTLKAVRVLEKADVILYDRLVGENVIKMIERLNKELIYVGKEKGKSSFERQNEINEMMRKYAEQGKIVVRLKGGDPLIFGRLASEIEYLCRHGIPFEIVPGISSVNGVPAVVNIPLTHPEFASCLIITTGKEELNLSEMIQKSTFVILMGKDSLKKVARNLVNLGLSEEVPVAVIIKGTLEGQKIHYSNLRKLMRERCDFEGPALIVVGKVVNFALLNF